MRDPRAGPGLRALRLPRDRAWGGGGRDGLLLRSVGAADECPSRPRMTALHKWKTVVSR